MTARDEAIAAMLPGLVQLEDDDLTFRWAGRLLDRIPGPVLARLVMERMMGTDEEAIDKDLDDKDLDNEGTPT